MDRHREKIFPIRRASENTKMCRNHTKRCSWRMCVAEVKMKMYQESEISSNCGKCRILVEECRLLNNVIENKQKFFNK
jgi:hypothetical protein